MVRWKHNFTIFWNVNAVIKKFFIHDDSLRGFQFIIHILLFVFLQIFMFLCNVSETQTVVSKW